MTQWLGQACVHPQRTTRAKQLFPGVNDPSSEEEETGSHPGRVPLNFNLLVFSCHSNFPSVVNDEGVEFRSTGGMWQFECPLERL